MAADDNRNISIKVTLDHSGALVGFEQLASAQTKTASASANTTAGFSKLQAAIISTNQALGLIKSTFNTVADTLNKANEINDVSDAFERLSKQAGVTSDVFINDLKLATDSTVTNFELMQKANKALIAGLDPKTFTLLIAEAKKYGDSIGISTTEAFDQLYAALRRGNEGLLTNLGLLKDGKLEFTAFAEQVALAADGTNTLADQSQKLLTEIVNLKDQFLAAAESSNYLNTLIRQTRDDMDRLSVVAKLVGVNFAALKSLVTGDESEFLEKLNAVDKQITGIKLKQATEAVARLKVEFKSGAITGKEYDEGILSIIDALKTLYISVEDQQKIFALSTEGLDGVAKGSKGAKKEIVDLADVLRKLGADREAKQRLEELQKAIQKANSIEGFKSFVTNVKDANQALTDGLIDGAKYSSTIQQLVKDMTDLNVPLAQQQRIIKAATSGSGGTKGNFLTNLLGIDPNSTKNQSELIGEQVQNLGSSLANAFADLKLDSSDASSISGSVGSLIGGAIGGSSAVGTALGSLSALGGPIGIALGGIVGSLVPTFIAALNKPDPQRLARQGVDKFFADLFDANRLTVVVDGELKKITDLVFGKGTNIFTTGTFDDIFASLPGAARESFAGVGEAFRNLAGVSEDIGAQIAAVLVNNIGGSLNNLQILVQATGKSFEELATAVEDAFLDGQISALEAQSALQGIDRLAQKGIPDSIGATVQAFQNLKDAGREGGRATVDSLKDIASEAKELGLVSLEDVKQNLLASGQFTAEEIGQLFTVLNSVGVSSLDQLETISNRTAIAIASNLDSAGFKFKEVEEKTTAIVDKINQIPDRQTKDLIFNVDVQYSESARSEVSQQALLKGNVKLPQGISA